MAKERAIQCLLCPQDTSFRTYGSSALGLHIAGIHKSLFEEMTLGSGSASTFRCELCKVWKSSKLYKLMNHVYMYHFDQSQRLNSETLLLRSDIANTNNEAIEVRSTSRCKLDPKQRVRQYERGLKKYYVRHGPYVFCCELCPYHSDSERAMDSHSTHHIRYAVGGYQCTKCGYASGERSDIEAHFPWHETSTAQPVTACELCQYRHVSPAAARQHTARHHSKEAITRTCSQCQYSANARRIVERHLRNDHHTPTSSDDDVLEVCGVEKCSRRKRLQSAGTGTLPTQTSCSNSSSSASNSTSGAGSSASAGNTTSVASKSASAGNSASTGNSTIAGNSTSAGNITSAVNSASGAGNSTSGAGNSAGAGNSTSVFQCPFCSETSIDANALYQHIFWGHRQQEETPK